MADTFRQRTGSGLVLLMRWLVPLVCVKIIGFGHRKIAGCNFYGPIEFLEASLEAIKRIEGRDGKITAAMRTEGYTFWYDPKNLVQCANLFSVSYNHLSWGPDGIIARIILAYFKVTIEKARSLVPSDKAGHVAASRCALKQTSAWLEANESPRELVDCYAKAR